MKVSIKGTDDLKDAISELIGLILGRVIQVLVAGFFVCLFWNLVIPNIFVGLNPLTYWQGVSLVMLCEFLFCEVGGSKDY